MSLTVHIASIARTPNAFPRIGIGGRISQPSGSLSGPGSGLFSWYANRRSSEGAGGRMRGVYPNCVPSLSFEEAINRDWRITKEGYTYLLSTRSAPRRIRTVIS